MKKIAYLSVLILSLVLVSTSCCKDDDPIVPDTYEQKYPDWVDLKWEKTTIDGVGDVDYPRYSYSIADNIITETIVEESGTITKVYNKMTLTSTQVTFEDINGLIGSTTWNYVKSGSTIILTFSGMSNVHYTLQIY